MLTGTTGHLGLLTLGGGMTTAAFCWIGFIVTTMTVNHGFQGANWMLTLIDSGHWLVVLLAQGAIIGRMGV